MRTTKSKNDVLLLVENAASLRAPFRGYQIRVSDLRVTRHSRDGSALDRPKSRRKPWISVLKSALQIQPDGSHHPLSPIASEIEKPAKISGR